MSVVCVQNIQKIFVDFVSNIILKKKNKKKNYNLELLRKQQQQTDNLTRARYILLYLCLPQHSG